MFIQHHQYFLHIHLLSLIYEYIASVLYIFVSSLSCIYYIVKQTGSNPGSNTTRDKVRIREQSRAKASLRTYTIVVNYGNIENRFAVNREETNVNVMLDTYVLVKTFNFVCVSEILI